MTGQEKEIQRLKNELLKADEEIRKLAAIKSDFISLISHELRTPITSIKESVSLVLDGVVGPVSEQQKKILIIARDNIKRLTKLITDILDMSKLEAGRVVLHKKKMDINELIKDVYASTKIEADRKNIEFYFSPGMPMESAWLDPDRIGRVVKSLISNAIKFNKEKGKVSISSSRESKDGRDFIKITVEDSGIGMPQEKMKDLFKDFNPLDMGMTRRHNGAGLSLAISKSIIGLHGGDIWAASEPDKGSKFIFTLPLYKKHEEFDFLMEEALEKSVYNGIKIALVILEIKDLKAKPADIIAETEDIIKKTVRGPEDKVMSDGKEGRIMIIAAADRLGVMEMIKRIGNNTKTPLFFGISIYPDETANKEELVKKAEKELENCGNPAGVLNNG
ncbi:MAG: ATP-binding protein [Candidatus Omnitrophota bacterium]|jgi:nitrogen-specific signal transduction histidine kinase